jgi:GABA permease
MRNPFRSEPDAYRFLLLTVAYFALVVASAAIDTRLGVLVFLVLSALVLWRLFRSRAVEPQVRERFERRGSGDERRILVVANETVGGPVLLDVIRERSVGVDENVLVVVPALNSPVRHWASDEDGARAAAQARLDASLARLAEAGIAAKGEVGDADPLQAIEDALRTFGADEIVISTHPEGRSHWLERGVVSGARGRFDVPIRHVVVDLAAADTSSP